MSPCTHDFDLLDIADTAILMWLHCDDFMTVHWQESKSDD